MAPTVLGRILVVDDELQLMEALVEALNAQGYLAHGFLKGVEAIEALQKQGFDVLLTDLMMPGMDGITLLKACMAIEPNLVGILMTGQGTVPTAVEAMRTGAFDYVLKPFRLDTILPVLERALEVQRLRLENIQLRETVAIYNLSQDLAMSLDPGLILEKTAEAALQQSGADEVSIMLLTPDRREFSIAAARGKNRERLLGERISLEAGIAGWVAQQAEALILNGEVSDPRFTPIHPRAEIRSAVSLPMLASGEIVGVLNINSLQPRQPFTPGQVKALRVLTSTAAAALANEALYRAMEAREKRFRALIENAPDGIALLGLDGKLRQVTPSTEQILGYTVNEAPGQDPAELTHPNDLPDLLVLLSELIQQPGKVVSTEYRFRHKDGSWRWLESTISNLITEPSVQAIVFNYHDITERKRAEEQIQLQVQRLKSLRAIDVAISSSFNLNLTLDILLNQVITQLNVDAAAILLFQPNAQRLEHAASHGFRSTAIREANVKLGEGYAGKAILEQRMIHSSNIIETDSELPQTFLLMLKEEGFVDYYGVPLLVKGEVKGALEIFHRTVLANDPEWLDFLETLAGQAAIAIQDATLFENLQRSNAELERRVAERTAELHQTNAELEHANRAKDEFLANMSHELRTPLNSILGLSESLLEQHRGPLNESQQKFLQLIESSGRHLLELINDILDLSKIEAGMLEHHPQLIPVEEICQASLSFVKTQAVKKSIMLNYTNEAPISFIYADPRRLKQIIVNLLTNAVKFTPESGEVTLHVHTVPEKELIQFSVLDTGIGIAPHDLKRLFSPFVQVDSRLNRQNEGTGLGLALVQKLTDLHGGSIEVESEVGKGSRFTINLHCKAEVPEQFEGEPIDDSLEAAERVERVDLRSIEPPKHPKILLAEDNAANILTIGDYLDSHGYEILVAHDGVEAIEKAKTAAPDMILMDIQMPIMDGLEATQHLRADSRFASTPIIALTALAMPGDRERCIEAGASEYMSKPLSLNTLLKTIRKFLAQEE